MRSSATIEDSEVSFAGQFETVLAVRPDRIEDAYRRVLASKYRFEAQEYARLSGLLDEEVAMPVLVMAMVPAVASGVAYSEAPDRPDAVLITGVAGLAAPLVEGRVQPDRFLVGRAEPWEILEKETGRQDFQMQCVTGGGIVETPLDGPGAPGRNASVPAVLDDGLVRTVARAVLDCEAQLGRPQDVEWAVGPDGVLFIVQSRPLARSAAAATVNRPEPAGAQVLVSGGVRACGGVGSGRVAHVWSLDETPAIEPGSVLVVPTTSPKLAGLVGRAAAILAQAGSATGHMATVAREFRVPMLVGVQDLFYRLPAGIEVTLDAWAGRVYEGRLAELQNGSELRAPQDPVALCVRRMIDRVSPLSLSDPRSPDFRVEGCRSLHDVARFAHQKALTELFLIEGLSREERREARVLNWRIPLEVLVLDVGGGIDPDAGRRVEIAQIRSVPFAALLEGMTDPRVRWAGPVGFDLKGFMSVVVRSAADDQRYGEPWFAVVSREFVHFNSRLAYHFATVASLCGPSEDQNYVRFVFHGGAAIAERREWRAFFLTNVLRYNGFQVYQVGDRVEAILGKRSAEVIEEVLPMLGRLMVCARHLDMMMENRAVAEAYAAAFLSGDYGFEFLKKGRG